MYDFHHTMYEVHLYWVRTKFSIDHARLASYHMRMMAQIAYA